MSGNGLVRDRWMTITVEESFTTARLWEAVWGTDGSGFAYWCPKVRAADGGGFDAFVMEGDQIKANPQTFILWDEDDQQHAVTLDDLRRGYELVRQNGHTHCGGYPMVLGDDNEDDCIADLIVQYAAFGEIVYG